MQSWLPFFVVVTALAVLVQVLILAALYLQFRRTNERMTSIANDLHSKLNPILARLQVLVEDTQPQISSLVSDAAEVVHLARVQAQKVDRVFTEAVDRLRLQLIHADQILTGALEAMEDAGTKFRRTVWSPVQNAAALVKGVKVGLDFFRQQRRHPERPGEQAQDESLFI